MRKNMFTCLQPYFLSGVCDGAKVIIVVNNSY
jgi:hypothetical protein